MAAETLSLTGLAVVLVVAAVALLVVRRLRQPMVLGYLVAGLLVGPFGFLPVQLVSAESVEVLAELGIVFIMVGLGLEFNPKTLRKIGAAPVGAGIFQMILSFLAARLAAHFLGYSDLEALFIAAALAISSTIVVVKILDERGELDRPHGRLAVGVLLTQDVAAIGFLAVAEGLSVTGSLGFGNATPVLLGLVVFSLAALVVGALIVPRVLNEAARGPSELLLVVVLGVVFTVTLLAEHLGFSLALGAFLVGAVIAETGVVHQAERMVEPLKHMFTAVFFVSIGMLIDPSLILASWRLVAIFSAIVIATRVVGTAVPAFLFGSPAHSAVRGGAALSQIGEFSFIVVSSGMALGHLDPSLFAVFVGVAGVTTLLTPYVTMITGPMLTLGSRVTPAPLRTYAQYYTGWVSRLGESEETALHRSTERVLARRIALNMVALLVIGALGFLAGQVLTDVVFIIGTTQVPAVWGIVPLVAVVSFPFLLVIWSSARQLAVEVVLELVPDTVAEQPEPPIALKVVQASLGLLMALGIGGIVLIFLPGAGPRAYLVIPVVAVLVSLAGILFWRRIQNMHAHVEGTIENLFGVSKTAAERDEVLRLIGRHYTVSLDTDRVVLPEGSALAHHQIRDAQIRNRTGATIVSVQRGRDRFVNPPPTTLLLPGDQLLLMGEPAHVAKAKALLTTARRRPSTAKPAAKSGEGDVDVREVHLSMAAEVAGQSIAAIGLRARTGASIVAAIRDHAHIQNPTPNFTLRPGDRLFLIGTPDQLVAAEAMLSRHRPRDAEPERGAGEGGVTNPT